MTLANHLKILSGPARVGNRRMKEHRGPMNAPEVTLVVVPRERFSCAKRSLESIYKHKGNSFPISLHRWRLTLPTQALPGDPGQKQRVPGHSVRSIPVAQPSPQPGTAPSQNQVCCFHRQRRAGKSRVARSPGSVCPGHGRLGGWTPLPDDAKWT